MISHLKHRKARHTQHRPKVFFMKTKNGNKNSGKNKDLYVKTNNSS